MAEAMQDPGLKIPDALKIPSRAGRVVTTFTVPLHERSCAALKEADDGGGDCNCNSPREDAGFVSVGLLVLTTDEEQRIMDRMKGAGAGMGLKLTYEMIKTAMVHLNGKAVSSTDESLDQAWSQIQAKGRVLVVKAFQTLHNPDKGVEQDFIKTRTSSA